MVNMHIAVHKSFLCWGYMAAKFLSLQHTAYILKKAIPMVNKHQKKMLNITGNQTGANQNHNTNPCSPHMRPKIKEQQHAVLVRELWEATINLLKLLTLIASDQTNHF